MAILVVTCRGLVAVVVVVVLHMPSSGGTRLGSAKSTIASLVSMKVDDRNRF